MTSLQQLIVLVINFLIGKQKFLLDQWILSVTVLALKDDNTRCSLHLHHLFYMLSMIMICDNICTKVNLYTIAICTDGIIMNMCPCFLLVLICIVSLVGHILLLICIYMNIE